MLFVPAQAKIEDKDNGGDVTICWNNTFQVTASSLNIRSGPGTSYSIVGSLSNGYIGYLYDPREINANGYTWVPIRKSDGTLWGWVAKQYITIIG